MRKQSSMERAEERISRGHPCVQEPNLPAMRGAVPPPHSHSSWRPSVFKSGRKCPTCHGTGRIPRGQDDELVALIPYSDSRLKPRKRYCVTISVVLVVLLAVLLVCGSVLLGFMFPRSASLTIVGINSTTELAYIYPNGTSLDIPMQTTLHIGNKNFFPLHVQWLRVELYNDNNKVGKITNQTFTVKARDTRAAIFSQNATFTGPLADQVWSLCSKPGWIHCLHILVEVEMQYSVLSQTAQTVTSKNLDISCDFTGPTSDWTLSGVCS